ncbi:hypothetical protein FOL47_011335 [Perkinsus chesapeaki]|uniref:CCHC-type domain-containing protein n=1 Tax=Perkinsus chesapeaki TaxID=330153 RepID=A0A7J6KYI3_PERCH|nr:hypothetical protein FOL47_011335 [Perkinsus chesapeaki]
MIGDFPIIEKDVDEAGNVAFEEYKALGVTDEVAEKARASARESATAHNEVVKALKAMGHGSNGGSSSSAARDTTALATDPVSSTVIQLMQTPMPERYDGISDFEDWLRRYEADGRGSGWSDLQLAERLGNYLRDVYFDVWHQHCGKTNFEEDRLLLLSMFSPVRPDEILAKFNSLTWDRSTRVVAFLTSLRRCMNAYNKSLPDNKKLPSDTVDQMIMDRLIANAPDAAKSVLRRRAPKTVKEVCEIFEDYKDKSGTSTQTTRPAANAHLQGTIAGNAGDISSVMQAMVGSLEKLIDQQEKRWSQGSQRGGKRNRNNRHKNGPPKCFLCEGAHYLYKCPHKKFQEGCFICGSKEHMLRDCSRLSAFRKTIADKKSTAESGNF